MLKYTICFIKKENELLLLNRNKKPNMGLWNGVGGKIEPNETPRQGVIRETLEETGISLKDVTYAGNVVWESDNGDSGMYVFIAELPEAFQLQTPKLVTEGILDWKSLDWILDTNNIGVVDNIKDYLPFILEGNYNLEHTFIYRNGQVLDYSYERLVKTEIELCRKNKQTN